MIKTGSFYLKCEGLEPVLVAHTCHLSSQEVEAGLGAQDHPWLYCKFKASLRNRRPCVKQTKTTHPTQNDNKTPTTT